MKILRLISKVAGRAPRPVLRNLAVGKCLLLLGALVLTNIAAGATPPTDWRWLLPSQVLPQPFHPGDFDVARGNGTFVGVGGYGAIATSPDGLTWTPVLPGVFDYFESVAFGGGVFVAVGGDNRISTSTNGMQWEHHPGVGNHDSLFSIRYLDGRFVAIGQELLTDVGNAGVLYSSPNGRQWTRRLRVLPPTGWDDVYLESMAHGNGRFVVVGSQARWDPDTSSSEGFTYTSADGMQWTRTISDPSILHPSTILFAGSVFVGLTGGGSIVTSADGTAWEVRHVLDEMNEEEGWWGWKGIASVGNRIICIAEQFHQCPTSEDPAGEDPPCRWHEEGFPRLTLSSDDGLSWQQTALAPTVPGESSPFFFSDDATFFAFGERSALSSPDGIAWTEHFTPHPLDSDTAGLWDVTYGEQGFLTVGWEGTILASRDGLSWQKRASGTEQRLGHVIYADSRYVATGDGGALIHSPDGETWTSADLGLETLPLGPISYGSGRFVLFTRNGGPAFWVSEDGIAWELQFSSALRFSDGISSVAFGNGRFLVTGFHFESNGGFYRSELAVSEDGITWQRVVLPEPYSTLLDPNLLFDGKRFLAWGGRFGRFLLESQDGLAWATLHDTPGNLASVGYGDGHILAVQGTQETLWLPLIGGLESSADGSSWTPVAPFQFWSLFEYPMRFAYGAGRFVGVGQKEGGGGARLLVSGFTPPLLPPQLEIRRKEARWMLRILGAAGSDWDLQQSSTLSGWETVRSVTLGAEPIELEVAPMPGGKSFWRLAAPGQ